MRTHETPCNTMNTTCQEHPRRIKSPQLYRLSYQPEYSRLLAILSRAVRRLVRIVPAVCPSLFSRAPYHERGPSADDSDVFAALRRVTSGRLA